MEEDKNLQFIILFFSVTGTDLLYRANSSPLKSPSELNVYNAAFFRLLCQRIVTYDVISKAFLFLHFTIRMLSMIGMIGLRNGSYIFMIFSFKDLNTTYSTLRVLL